jgi:hypothetical protein
MKKIAMFCFLYSITLTAFADQCPNAANVVVCKYGNCTVTPPAGWRFYDAKNIDGVVNFSVAAWGNHATTTDNVRCYYYTNGQAGSVQIRSEQSYPESSVKNHSNWSDDSNHYHMCSSYNVGDCQFG